MLHGKKVTLRSVRREDLQHQSEFNNDVEFELLGGGDPWEPQSLQRLEAQFDAGLEKGDRDGPHFAIEADGLYIGNCGLFHFDDAAGTCELGIGIGHKAYWGQGYGRDAVRVLLEYAFRLRNMRKVWLAVNGNNPRAMRAYAACGFVEEGRLRRHVWSNGEYIDLIHMGLLRVGGGTLGIRLVPAHARSFYPGNYCDSRRGVGRCRAGTPGRGCFAVCLA